MRHFQFILEFYYGAMKIFSTFVPLILVTFISVHYGLAVHGLSTNVQLNLKSAASVYVDAKSQLSEEEFTSGARDDIPVEYL